jgi:DNA/RNA endonuclease YhcR with UshA esterase domain
LRFRLDDGTGQITLLTWLDVYDGIVGREGLRTGASVQVMDELGQYEEEMQIVPASSEDILILGAGERLAPTREIGSLTTDDAGSWVAVEGQVVRAQAFDGGLRVYLDDGSGSGLLLLWQNVLERLPEGAGAPAVGSRLRATGRVENFQGTLEIVPVFPFDLEAVATPAATLQPTNTPPPPILPIGELDASWSGEVVTVTGQVVDTASFAQGFKFTLDDGTGQVVLLTWHNVYDECDDAPQLRTGATVRATGEIGKYEGELQIEPEHCADVKVMARGDAYALERAIGAIGDTVGQRVTISGQVKRTENTDSGIKLFVGDDTGEALVYIWSNILERVPDHEALAAPGTQVRITGMVQEYRGELEIVPALPYDVEVLE